MISPQPLKSQHTLLCFLLNVVLENYSVQNSPRRYIGSPMSSDTNALNSCKFKVTYITVT